MSFTHKLGANLATATPVGLQTGLGKQNGDTSAVVITVEGPAAALESIVPNQGDTTTQCAYVPAGCYVQTASLSGDGRGNATLRITCIDPSYGSGSSSILPTKVTYRIEMAEERTDLISHPHVADFVDILVKWMGTADTQKYDAAAEQYQYDTGDGITFAHITEQAAIDFCTAWMHGIKTYNRYFPVVEKISIYKRPPGMTMNGASISGGSPTFSSDIGTWDAPNITLNGFPSTGFFKSKDSYVQNANTSWTRTEQWVWTPDGSSSNYGWIYSASSAS